MPRDQQQVVAVPVHLDIEIENPQPVYTCGDQIKGVVHVKADSPISIQKLHVQLMCQATTQTRGLDQAVNPHIDDYTSTSIPYCFIRRLVTESQTLSNHLDFNFDFTLPTETKRNSIEPAWLPSETFEHLADHALPPTWISDPQLRGQVIHFVEAVIVANRLPETDHSTRQELVVRRPFEFTPTRATDNPDARCVRMTRTIKSKLPKSLVNIPEAPPRRKSIKGLLTIEEKLSVDFQVEVLCPTVLCAGGPIPVSVAVCSSHSSNQVHLRQASRENTPPDSPMMNPVDTAKGPLMFIEGVYAYLEASTTRRVKGASHRSQCEHTLLMSDMAPVCNIMDRPIAVSHVRDRLTALHPHYPELRLRPDTTPTFRSFSLNRKYTLHLRIRVAIGDQEHAVDVAWPLLILPKIYRNTAGAIGDMGGIMPGLRRRISEETLPPYEPVDPRLDRLDDPPPLVW